MNNEEGQEPPRRRSKRHHSAKATVNINRQNEQASRIDSLGRVIPKNKDNIANSRKKHTDGKRQRVVNSATNAAVQNLTEDNMEVKIDERSPTDQENKRKQPKKSLKMYVEKNAKPNEKNYDKNYRENRLFLEYLTNLFTIFNNRFRSNIQREPNPYYDEYRTLKDEMYSIESRKEFTDLIGKNIYK